MWRVKKILRAALAVMAMTLCVTAAARSPVPVVDHDSIAVVTGSGKPISATEVGDAIARGAAGGRRSWVVARSSPSRMRATYSVRTHAISVDIEYTEQAYSIHYAGSDNMKFSMENGVKLIHPFYNNWVQELMRSISAELSKL